MTRPSHRRHGRPARRGAGPDPALLHPRRGVATTCARCTRSAAATPTPSTGTAGATTRSSAPRTGSTAPAPARGRSTSRTASSPGRPSRPTTPRSGRTSRSTSPAAARGAPPSPGTPTRPPGSATPTCAACCCRCTARRKAPARRRPGGGVGARSSTTRARPRRTSPPAARAGWCARPWDEATEMVAAAHVHTIKQCGPDRVAGFSPIPAMSMVSPRLRRPVHLADRRHDAVVLRLVRRPAGRLAAGVRRPDRRARVGRLVGRRLPDHVGLQRPGDPHPDAHWMAEARYRGQKVVAVSPDYADNVKFADEWLAVHARHRRRAGDGDGPRHPQGVLRRPADAVLRRLRASSTPTCRSWSARRGRRRRRVPARQVPHRGRPRRRTPPRRTPHSRPCCSTAAPASRSCRNGSLGYRFGDAGVGRWNLDLGGVDPLLTAARHGRRRR